MIWGHPSVSRKAHSGPGHSQLAVRSALHPNEKLALGLYSKAVACYYPLSKKNTYI